MTTAANRYRLERPEFLVWLERCLGTGYNHGSELAMSLRMADNVREADETLRAAEELGWIVSTGCAPNVSQQFFGVGSLDGSMSWARAKRQRDSGSARNEVFNDWNRCRSMHGFGPGPQAPYSKLWPLGAEQLSFFRRDK